MRMSQWLWVVVAAMSVMASSCGGTRDKPLVGPVTGTVLVDGQPAHAVFIAAVPKVKDEVNVTYTTGTTDDQGKFSLQTYNPDDGVPPGEYSLYFTWPTGGNRSVDRLDGRYSKKAASVKTFTIDAETADDKPVDLGTIELTTK